MFKLGSCRAGMELATSGLLANLDPMVVTP